MRKQKFAALATGVALMIALAGHALAGGMAFGRSQAPAPLEGTWDVVITPYVCDTGAPLTTAAFKSRLTFHAGGTMTETTFNPSFQAGQRSIGMGMWERTGQNSYHNVFAAYILFTSAATPPTPPRYTRGFQRIDQGIEMLDNDHWTSSANVVFRDEAQNVIPPTGCMTAVGERLQ